MKKNVLYVRDRENFCELSHDERRIATLDNTRLMYPSLQLPSPSRSSGQSLSPDSPSRNSFTPSPDSVFSSITPTTPEYDLLKLNIMMDQFWSW